MIQSTTGATPATGNDHDAEYAAYLRRLQARYEERSRGGTEPVFATDADDLWEVYIGAHPEAERQYHTCNACRHFIQRYGSLVTIDDRGRTSPLFWDEGDAEPVSAAAVRAMAARVKRAKVNGVFLPEFPIWGTPRTGTWVHLGLRQVGAGFRDLILIVSQKMAERREDFRNVSRALAEFTPATVDTALTLLRTDSLYRSEKVLGQAEWLAKLHADRAAVKGADARSNVTWRAVALAPAGFCHPRASMIGSLLDDIAAGMGFTDVSKRFAAKMHPLQYQRPQAAPSAGTIAQAEKIIERLQAAGSLRRRFARVDEIEAVWRPKVEPKRAEAGGVFGHLAPKGATPPAPAMEIPPQIMTWAKFQGTVLPTAERMEVLAPARGNYAALVTAADQDAPPIIQWDREDRRNPFSLYMWQGGSPATQWGLRGGAYHAVAAVTMRPHMWYGGGFDHHGKGVVFVIDGAKDTRTDSGAVLFPENIRTELHGVRSVIEAYSRRATLEGREDQSAAGLHFGNRGDDITLRIWSSGRALIYKLDRWD